MSEIVANPASDAPRLAFADWLEERGDVRGEFIRVQCVLAALGELDPRQAMLEDREQELLKTYRPLLSGGVTRHVGAVEFRRGFVEGVSMRLSRFLRTGQNFMHLAPIRRLTLRGGRDQVADLASSPLLDKIESLNLSSVGMGQRLRFFSRRLQTDSLVELNLSGNGLTNEELPAMTSPARLGQLRGLSLCSNRLTDNGLKTLAAWPTLSQLTELRLGHNPITAKAVKSLVNAGLLEELVTLDLSRTSLYAQGITALTTSRELSHLRSLILRENTSLNEGALQLLAKSENIRSLRQLDITQCHLTGDNCLILVSSPWFSGLSSFELSGNTIDKRVASLLASHRALPHFTTLDFSSCSMGAPELQALLKDRDTMQVRRLILSFNNLGDAGAEALANSPALRNIEFLDLTGNRIGDVGARALAQSPYLNHLTQLHLSKNRISDVGSRRLRNSSFAEQLEKLSLKANRKLGASECKRLSDRFGNRVTLY